MSSTYGRGIRRIPGQMNRMEADYAGYLEGLKRAGTVLWYAFDAVKLRLAQKTFYEPDFLVLMADLVFEIHEVKGHWEDDARVKIKVAAEKFPIRFVAVTRERGLWVFENLSKSVESPDTEENLNKGGSHAVEV